MTEPLTHSDTCSDADLIARVRGGDSAAYGELFERHHAAADRLSRHLVPGPDSDDLVSEAFAKVLTILQRGGGPDLAFRAYLLTAVRRLHVDRIRARSRLHSSGDMTPFDPGIPFQDTAVDGFEHQAAARAFAALPERWQTVLWHLEVEGQKPAEIAPMLGMTPNSVSALAYRAREGLRQSFLQMHLAELGDEDCRWANEHLGAHVRRALSRRDAATMENHLSDCRRCTGVYLELEEVNSGLGAILAPALLGSAAAGYLATGSGGAVVGSGLAFVVGRARDLLLAHSTAATATGIAAGVAAAATTGALVLQPPVVRPAPQHPRSVVAQPAPPVVELPAEDLVAVERSADTVPTDATGGRRTARKKPHVPARTGATIAPREAVSARDVPAVAPSAPTSPASPDTHAVEPHPAKPSQSDRPVVAGGPVAPDTPGSSEGPSKPETTADPEMPAEARPSPDEPVFSSAPHGVTAARPNQFSVDTTVSGLTGAPSLDLFFARPQERFLAAPAGCQLINPSRVRCSTDGQDALTLHFTAQLPGRDTGLLYAATAPDQQTSSQIVLDRSH